MSTDLRPEFSDALRHALIDHVSSSRGRRRRFVAGWFFGGAVLLAGGVATAAQFDGRPGTDRVEHLADPVTVEGVGTQTVELGTRPDSADYVDLQLTCLTAGTFGYADGASMSCRKSDVGRSGESFYQLALGPGEHTTTITATPDARWRLIATYADLTQIPWGTNQRGESFGAENEHGQPDLVAVVASNHKEGYAYARDLAHPVPSSPAEAMRWQNGPRQTVWIPVYEADGTTQIGVFKTERPALASAAPRPVVQPSMPSRSP